MAQKTGSSGPSDSSIPVARSRLIAKRPNDKDGMAGAVEAAEDAGRLQRQAADEIERSRLQMRRSAESIAEAAADAIETSDAIEASRRKIAQRDDTTGPGPGQRRTPAKPTTG